MKCSTNYRWAQGWSSPYIGNSGNSGAYNGSGGNSGGYGSYGGSYSYTPYVVSSNWRPPVYHAPNPNAINNALNRANSGGSNLSLLFNGKRLFIVDEDKGHVVYSTLATSGKGEYMNNPSAQNISGKGPIQSGNYTFENTQWKRQSATRQVFNIIRGYGDWGYYNVPLTPQVPGSRSHFFLHGGIFEGSHGCIDAGENIGIIYNYLKTQKTTILRVKYKWQ